MWSHLQDGPVKAQQDSPRLIPNAVNGVREAAQEQFVAQATPGRDVVRIHYIDEWTE